MQGVAAFFQLFFYRFLSYSFCHILTICDTYQHFPVIAINSSVSLNYRDYTTDTLRN